MTETECPDGFSHLFRPRFIDYANADIRGTLAEPTYDLVHRVHVIATPEPGLVTVCSSQQGGRFLPGGRLEPGEGVHDTLARELLEEAGCEPTGEARFFFSHIATSRRDTPYLPHAPHPVMWWTYAVSGSRVVGAPTSPVDGEQIVDVLHLPVEQAVAWLGAADDGTDAHADIVRLAAVLQLL